MQLSVKGKHIDVGDSLRDYVENSLKSIVGKYFDGTLNAHVTFSREAHLFCADITIHAGRGITLQSNASASEAYPAFDIAAERIANRLRRYKKRLVDHHQEAHAEEAIAAQSFILHAEDENAHGEANDNPVVVAEMTTPIETLSVSEAVMRMDLGNLPALLFRSRAHGTYNMIYRRHDGHIGWVEPAQNLNATSTKKTAAAGM